LKGFKWENDRILRDNDVPRTRAFTGGKRTKRMFCFAMRFNTEKCVLLKANFRSIQKRPAAPLLILLGI